MPAGEVVTAGLVAVAPVAAEGAVMPVPLAALPDVPGEVPEVVPVAADGELSVPLEMSVLDGVAALGVAGEVAGVLLVVALSEGDADCALAIPARASAAEPSKSFRSSVDMVIPPVKKRERWKASFLPFRYLPDKRVFMKVPARFPAGSMLA